MSGYSPLFGEIVTSSIWNEDAYTCKVWITLLALADYRGNVYAGVAGLAPVVRGTFDETEKAINKLLSPDRYSRSPEKEGRRIEVIEGGWHIINYAKFRKKAQDRNEYFKQWREEKKREKELKKAQAQLSAAQRSAKAQHNEQNEHSATNGDITVTPPLPIKKRASPFLPPTVEQVEAYCRENNYQVDAKEFIRYYAAANWHGQDGKPVKNWKQKIIAVWSKKDGRTPKNRRNTGFDYDKDPDSIEIRA